MEKISNVNTGNIGNLQQIGVQKAGRDIHIHNHAPKKESLKLKPVGPTRFDLELAKRYFGFISKGKKEFVLGAVLPLILSGALIQDFWLTMIFKSLYILMAGLLILILEAYAFVLKSTTVCPKCKEGFAMEEVGRELVNSKKYDGKRVDNINITEKCRYCRAERTEGIVEETELKRA